MVVPIQLQLVVVILNCYWFHKNKYIIDNQLTMKKTNEKLSEILEIEPISYEDKNQIQTVPSNLTLIDDDAEFARQNIRHLIEKGNDAMEGILSVAKASDHPRAYEVAANMLKHLTDMNKDLMEIQKRKRDLQPKETSPTNGINVDKAVFVGSTKELVKLLKSKE